MLKKLGKYELIGEVGRGAMGEVFKAYDPSIRRFVALKTITSSLLGNPDLLERFYREARSAGTLQHPNIVTVYELGTEGETPFIAMEFLEGESLEKIIERRSPLSVMEKLNLVLPVCRAIDYAHKRGVFHRDIKPGNVMLTKEGNVKVVDFGIARLADGAMTQTNVFMGTIGYMSPEQILGERADGRSDIWSLGVMLYELLCYRRPFESDNHMSLMLDIVNANSGPAPLAARAPDCPPLLEKLVRKMLQKDVNRRFQTMEDVLFDLEPIWKEVQEASVSGLVTESEAAIGTQEFTRARDLLQKALRINSLNDRVKALLERVNADLKQRQTHSRIKNALERAKGLLNEGRHHEARLEADAALELDHNYEATIALLAEIEGAVKRARLIAERLQAGKLFLAKGALTEAGESVKLVLELDATNVEASELQNQIQSRLLQREQRRRRQEILHRARMLWGEQHLADCVDLLVEAQKEFPDDSEIAKQLEAVKEDLFEQEKQQKLGEARNLLAGHRFDEALAIVDPLLGRQPADRTVLKLHLRIREEKESLLREEKFRGELASIQSFVSTEKFAEALSRGESLLQEYPGRVELVNAVGRARAEIAHREEKRERDRSVEAIQKKMQAGKFQDAISAAEKALVRFPGDPDLGAMLAEGRAKYKEAENRELIHKRIGEIQRSIKAGKHTDAVDLATQTLATVGQDVQVTQLLRAAEMELEGKRKRKEEQDKRVAEMETLLHEGRFNDVTQILQNGLETEILSETDPRVREMLAEVQHRSSAVTPADRATHLQPSNEPYPPSELSNDFLLKDSSRLETTPAAEPHARANDSVAESFSATIVFDSRSQRSVPGASEYPAGLPSSPVQPQENQTIISSSEISHHDVPVTGLLPRLAQTCREHVVALAACAAVLIVIIVVATYFILQSRINDEVALRNHAQQLEQQKHWPAAIKEYENLAARGGDLASFGVDHAKLLRDLLAQENSLANQAQGDESRGNYSEAMELYLQIANLHGDKEQEALSAVGRLNKEATPTEEKPPAPPKPDVPHKPENEHRVVETTPPAPVGKSCQLLERDIPFYLDRADRNRARGNYGDAERLYNSVLGCDPQNPRAVAGLNRTREAKAVPNR